MHSNAACREASTIWLNLICCFHRACFECKAAHLFVCCIWARTCVAARRQRKAVLSNQSPHRQKPQLLRASWYNKHRNHQRSKYKHSVRHRHLLSQSSQQRFSRQAFRAAAARAHQRAPKQQKAMQNLTKGFYKMEKSKGRKTKLLKVKKA